MDFWDIDQVREMLDEFRAGETPDDPKERKRLLIVRAATDLFARQGYRRTNVAQVAERAGVAKGTVYLYFSKKPELLLHAVVEEKRRYLERVAHLFDSSIDPVERLRLWLEAAFLIGEEIPLMAKLLGGDRELLSVLYELGAEMGRDWKPMQVEIISQMIAGAIGTTALTRSEIEDRARMLLGLVFFAGSIPDPRVRGELSTSRYAELLARTIADGLVLPGRGAAREEPEQEVRQ
ncbi:MAG: helix-turn-helix domain-containing protein [Polyangia bacterium]